MRDASYVVIDQRCPLSFIYFYPLLGVGHMTGHTIAELEIDSCSKPDRHLLPTIAVQKQENDK